EVVRACRVVGVAFLLPPSADEQRLGGDVLADLGQQGMVDVGDVVQPGQRCGSFGGHFQGRTKVHHRVERHVVHQQRHVGGGEVLEIVRPQQSTGGDLRSVVGGDPADVTGVHGTFELQPHHGAIVPASAPESQ